MTLVWHLHELALQPFRKTIFHPPSAIHYASGVRWNKIAIIGIGLLGGSLGLAIKKRRLARRVVGFARREATITEALKLRALDTCVLDSAEAVKDADLIVLCTPIAQMRSLVKLLLPGIKRGAIVTDVGSVKASVVRDLESLVAKAGAYFVGSHPMAGAEKNGVAWSQADLYEGSACVVTPTRRTNRPALRKVEALWRSVGGRVLQLSPERHDALVSQSSHLPHVVAATLAMVVLNPKWPKEQAGLCATGFRDTTRIASGSPEMWRDIAVANRKQLRVALDGFVRALQQTQAILRRGRPEEIARIFETAKQRRDDWCKRAALTSPE